MSDVPPSEIADIRKWFTQPGVVSQPLILAANTLRWRLLREVSLAFFLLALALNYFQSHKSWGIALLFLGFLIGAIGVLQRFNRRRYRQDLGFCLQSLNTVRLAPLSLRLDHEASY